MADSNVQKVDMSDYIHRIDHENCVARLERANRRLWIALLISILIISAMFFYETQYEDVYVQQEVDTGDGDGDTVIAGVGDAYYGKNKADDQSPEKENRRDDRI